MVLSILWDSGKKESYVRKIRVLIVLDSFGLGGTEKHALALSEFLGKLDSFEVLVTSLIYSGRLLEDFRFGNVKTFDSRFHSNNNLVRQIIEMINFALRLRKYKPDILLPYTIRPNVICNFAWQLSGAESCVWNQHDEGFGFHPRDKIFRWSLRNASNYIAISNSALNVLLRFGIQKSLVKVINNGISLKKPVYTVEYWKNLIGTTDRKSVVMVANLSVRKDHFTVLKAWSYMKSQNLFESIPLLVFAGGKMDTYGNLIETTKLLGLQNDVIFLDLIDDVSGLLYAADVAVHSSLSEGMPLAVLEYMAAGKIIVASDILAHREILGDGYHFLFKPRDYVSLSKNIACLLENLDVYATLGEKNRLQFLNNYTEDQMLKLYELFFRNCFEKS